jgi:hypothetical protein
MPGFLRILDDEIISDLPERLGAALPKGIPGQHISLRADPKVLEDIAVIVAKRLDPHFKTVSDFIRWSLCLGVTTYYEQESLLDTPEAQQSRADLLLIELEKDRLQSENDSRYLIELQDALQSKASRGLSTIHIISNARKYAALRPEIQDDIEKVLFRYT